MANSGKRRNVGESEEFDFSLGTKTQHRARRRELVLADSETLHYEFQQVKEKVNWDVLRPATTEVQVEIALLGVDQLSRDRLPRAATILAAVRDPNYPKLRPISFLADSCALAVRNKQKGGELYAPRYSRDICYQERKRRGPVPKPPTDLEYWREQAKLGQRVPTRLLRKINKKEANERQKPIEYGNTVKLTYSDIPEKIGAMKKEKDNRLVTRKDRSKAERFISPNGCANGRAFSPCSRSVSEPFVNISGPAECYEHSTDPDRQGGTSSSWLQKTYANFRNPTIPARIDCAASRGRDPVRVSASRSAWIAAICS